MQPNSSPDDKLRISVIQLSFSYFLNPLVSHSAPHLFIYFRQRDGRSKQYQKQKFSSCSAWLRTPQDVIVHQHQVSKQLHALSYLTALAICHLLATTSLTGGSW